MRNVHPETYAIDPGCQSRHRSYSRRTRYLAQKDQILPAASQATLPEGSMAVGKERSLATSEKLLLYLAVSTHDAVLDTNERMKDVWYVAKTCLC